MFTLYHNPRCSKSRAALALLKDSGVAPRVINYLTDPPDAATLKRIVAMLNAPAREIIRQNEDAYRELNRADALGDDELLAAIAANPKLLQRPLAVHRGRAVIGRPPEKVLTLL